MVFPICHWMKSTLKLLKRGSDSLCEIVMEERKEEDAYLVTGNIKHFPERPYVVTPRQMLNIILEDQETYQADP